MKLYPLLYSEVYNSNQRNDNVSRQVKFLLCILYLLTIAVAMSLASQGFFWGFPLFLIIPILFAVMRTILLYQGFSDKVERNGSICMIISVLMILFLSSAFIYSYKNTYGTYFSQKYSSKWCRTTSVNHVNSSLPDYDSIIYQVLSSQDDPTTIISSTAVFGCGCKFSRKQSLSVNNISGYEYVLNNSGGLINLPFWICSDQEVTLSASVFKCFVYTKGYPSKETLNNVHVCELSDQFIQVSLDSSPYFSAKLFLYLIGLFLIPLFGSACYFPMGFVMIKCRTRSNRVVQPEERPLERRKLYMWKAIQKTFVEEPNNKAAMEARQSNFEVKVEGRKIWREEILFEIFKLIQVPYINQRFIQRKKQVINSMEIGDHVMLENLAVDSEVLLVDQAQNQAVINEPISEIQVIADERGLQLIMDTLKEEEIVAEVESQDENYQKDKGEGQFCGLSQGDPALASERRGQKQENIEEGFPQIGFIPQSEEVCIPEERDIENPNSRPRVFSCIVARMNNLVISECTRCNSQNQQ